MKLINVFVLLFSLYFNTSYSQNYLDFYFKSRSINGAIIIVNEDDTYFASNRETEGMKETPPSNLFHLFAYLMIYDKNIHKKESLYLKWDSVNRYFFNETRKEWNKDTDLDTAFKEHNDWYFQTYLNDFTKEEIEQKLKVIGYTNKKWNDEIPYYWQFGGMLITANQQIKFLKKLFKKELPFSVESQEKLLQLLKINQNPSIKLYGLDAFTVYNGERIDWFTGVLEKEGKHYFFSTRTYHNIETDMNENYPKEKFVITSEIFDILYLL